MISGGVLQNNNECVMKKIAVNRCIFKKNDRIIDVYPFPYTMSLREYYLNNHPQCKDNYKCNKEFNYANLAMVPKSINFF